MVLGRPRASRNPQIAIRGVLTDVLASISARRFHATLRPIEARCPKTLAGFASDALARKHHLTRAALVEMGLRLVLRAR